MTQVLISVRNASEAALVVPVSPGIIDLKEPNNGPLGRATAATASEFLNLLPASQTCSLALGEVVDFGGSLDELKAIPAGFHYAKVGLAGALKIPNWSQRWRAIQLALPASVEHVAVAYLDHSRCAAPEVDLVIDYAVEFGCGAVLLDTFDKSRGSFDEIVSIKRLAGWLERIQRANMLSVLAGSVNQKNQATALQLKPDFVGVRGAICEHERTGSVSAQRLNEFCSGLAESVDILVEKKQAANRSSSV